MQPTDEPPVRSRNLEAAFADFYRARYGTVLAFVVRRVADRETAREITADVFHVAWSTFEPGAEPRSSWLFAIARNRIGDSYRRSARELRLREALRADAAAAGPPVLDDPRVESTLSGLAAAAREVLVLTYWDGLSAAEAAEVLGISTAAAWVRLHRARRAFAAAWTKESQ